MCTHTGAQIYIYLQTHTDILTHTIRSTDTQTKHQHIHRHQADPCRNTNPGHTDIAPQRPKQRFVYARTHRVLSQINTYTQAPHSFCSQIHTDAHHGPEGHRFGSCRVPRKLHHYCGIAEPGEASSTCRRSPRVHPGAQAAGECGLKKKCPVKGPR